MSVSPCKYCFIHTPACHGQCEFYAEWAEEKAQEREAIFKKKFNGNMLRSYKRDACEKQRKKHGGR